jgi:epoxyqueuosine reductase QueG
MNFMKLEKQLAEYLRAASANYVPEDAALGPGIAGMRIFDDPIVGVCDARDERLLSFADNDEANLRMLMPDEWMSEARSVVSVFLPLAERVRVSNYGPDDVSLEWLHGRIEGQACVVELAKHLAGMLGDAVIPILDPRFAITRDADAEPHRMFSSNWSERHVAYAAGLGTFSMHGGLLTRRGGAGRLVSVITSREVEPVCRAYDGIYDYCTACGLCAQRCPAGAISPDMKKDAVKCSAQVDVPRKVHPQYYGCGKCQTNVPCEMLLSSHHSDFARNPI